MTVTVHVVKDNIPAVIRVIETQAGEVGKDVADGIKDAAQRFVPVLSGALRSSIHVSGGGDNYQITADSREGGAPRAYAGYVEYGTSKMHAQPYMMPGFVEGVATSLPAAIAEFAAKIEAAAS